MALSDIVFLQDLTGSYGNDLPVLQALLPAVVNRLTNPVLADIFGADINFGIASFKDKPIFPFGDPGDYVYQAELGLTNNITVVKNTIRKFDAFGGNDLPESQLDALLYAALDNGGSLGYRAGSSRIVFLATDADYHKPGDRATASPFDTIPNNGDAVIDPFEDYATIPQVRTALENNNIIPIFLVKDDATDEFGKPIRGDVTNAYGNPDTKTGLIYDLGRGGVLTLSSRSENVADAIKEAVARSRNVISTDVVATNGDDFFIGGNFSPGDKVVFGGGGNDSISLAGVAGNHFIDGGAGSDILFGGSGADRIDGGSDDDNLVGGNGNDILLGSSGDDTLNGGGGNDYLQGDSGIDTLTGGPGSDTFGFATGSKFDIKELNVDTIVDFSPIQGDKIQLSKFTFEALSTVSGTLNAAEFAIVTNDASAEVSSAFIVYNSANGNLFYNPNGSASGFDAVSDFGGLFVEFAGRSSFPALTAASFEVVA